MSWCFRASFTTRRFFSTTKTDAQRLYDAFATDAPNVVVGQSWTPDLLRKKSFDDLHKLWYVLLKEKNRLETIKLFCKTKQAEMPDKDRMKKVCQAMARIKIIVHQRSEEIQTSRKALEISEANRLENQKRREIFLSKKLKYEQDVEAKVAEIESGAVIIPKKYANVKFESKLNNESSNIFKTDEVRTKVSRKSKTDEVRTKVSRKSRKPVAL